MSNFCQVAGKNNNREQYEITRNQLTIKKTEFLALRISIRCCRDTTGNGQPDVHE